MHATDYLNIISVVGKLQLQEGVDGDRYLAMIVEAKQDYLVEEVAHDSTTNCQLLTDELHCHERVCKFSIQRRI
jgi:hypothetical protein